MTSGARTRGPLTVGTEDGRRTWVHWRGKRHALTIERRSAHRAYFSKRQGHVRWHYLGPACWALFALDDKGNS